MGSQILNEIILKMKNFLNHII